MGDAFAAQVRAAIVKLRTNPSHFASSVLGPRMTHYDSEGRYVNPRRSGAPAPLVTKEGPKGVRSAMKKLLKAEALTGEAAFEPDSTPGLDLSAADVAEDLTKPSQDAGAEAPAYADRMNCYGAWGGSCGQIVWSGELGEEAGVDGLEVVTALVIDDGSRKNKNRKMLLDPKFRMAGVAVATQRGSAHGVVVLHLATTFAPDEGRIKRRQQLGAAGFARQERKAARKQKRGGGAGGGGGGGGEAAGSPTGNECGGCGLNIRGRRVITALDRNWHEKCFTCRFCETNLAKVQFVTEPDPAAKEGAMPMVMCSACWQQKFGKHCHLCGKFIAPGLRYKILQTEPKQYEHEECGANAKAAKAAERAAAREERRRNRGS